MADMADIKFLQPISPLLGGAIGTTRILSQAGSGITTLTGVTIEDAAGNNIGDGTLTFNFAAKTLTWRGSGESTGDVVDISVDGSYSIQSASNGGVVLVAIVAASLPGGNIANTITISSLSNKIFDDVTKDESDVGMTDYRLVYLKNDSADIIKEIKLWIGSNATGEDSVSIGLDPVGVSGAGAIIADENTAPAGVTYTAPSTSVAALNIGTLTAGQFYGFWIKRLVPLGVTTEVLDDTFSLSFSAKV